MGRSDIRIAEARPAGPGHRVVAVVGDGPRGHRRRPCATCPWRVDAVGAFPAEAFRLAASTAHDMARHEFACHESGRDRPATCAGFLLRGSAHNLATRLKEIRGEVDRDGLSDDGLELFDSYRAMAEANGVPPDDPALDACR